MGDGRRAGELSGGSGYARREVAKGIPNLVYEMPHLISRALSHLLEEATHFHRYGVEACLDALRCLGKLNPSHALDVSRIETHLMQHDAQEDSGDGRG